jgi:transcriptional regulator with PAS, ATPase and Fis domain
MQALLQRDHFTTADWNGALHDLASLAKEAVDAREALVAIYAPEAGTWTAVTSQGQILSQQAISRRASRSVLEQVRQTQQPVLATDDAMMDIDSESVRRNRLESVLAVPLYFWDVTEHKPQRSFGGCLYAHRTLSDSPFEGSDVELIRDVTEVVQRTLNVLRHLKGVESDLEATRERLDRLQRSTAAECRLGRYETRDPVFAENVLKTLQRIAHADKVGLLILGPTGSGKSFLAQAYHYGSPRRRGPFVVLDCSQVTSEQTLAAELFGYAPRSGFVNAPERGRLGAAELAHRGTLFIDEVASLTPSLQQRLLSLIQTGTFCPLGSSEKRSVDLQVLAATNEELEARVGDGRFREDLLWRLSEVAIRMPPLNERAADIPDLAESFLRAARERFKRREVQGLTERAKSRLLTHDWSRSGNIRGLETTLHRSVLLAAPGTRVLDAEDLRFEPGFGAGGGRSAGPAARTAPAGTPRVRPGSRLPAEQLLPLLERKLHEHHGTISAMSADPEVSRTLGYRSGRMPASSLQLRLRELGLSERLEQERERRREELGRKAPDLEAIRHAIQTHRSATTAARALGVNRDVLIWRLRQAGQSVREILAQARGAHG